LLTASSRQEGVLIADVNEEAAYEALRRLPEGPGSAIAMAVNVSAEGAGEAMVARCVQQFSSVNVLVNNAGVFPQLPMLRRASFLTACTESTCKGWPSPRRLPLHR
jgi:NAD(P)-dependent dehydrogenase (short-subunit alcohol dehydrogenase family)